MIASSSSDSVLRSSLHTLKPGKWVNDEVINYYLKNCLAARNKLLCKEQPGRKRSHLFNSFFFQNLFDEKNNNLILHGRYNHSNVLNWLSRLATKDLFDLKYVVCPLRIETMSIGL